eukprot:2178085-Prymnesium_polylepis.1
MGLLRVADAVRAPEELISESAFAPGVVFAETPLSLFIVIIASLAPNIVTFFSKNPAETAMRVQIESALTWPTHSTRKTTRNKAAAECAAETEQKGSGNS